MAVDDIVAKIRTLVGGIWLLVLTAGAEAADPTKDFQNFVSSLSRCVAVESILHAIYQMSLQDVRENPDATASIRRAASLSDPTQLRELLEVLVPDEGTRTRFINQHSGAASEPLVQLMSEQLGCTALKALLDVGRSTETDDSSNGQSEVAETGTAQSQDSLRDSSIGGPDYRQATEPVYPTGAAKPEVSAAGSTEHWTLEALDDIEIVRYYTNGFIVYGHQFGFIKRSGMCDANFLWISWSSTYPSIQDWKGKSGEFRIRTNEREVRLDAELLASVELTPQTQVVSFGNALAPPGLVEQMRVANVIDVHLVGPAGMVDEFDMPEDMFDIKGFAHIESEAKQKCLALTRH
jgi:hypothetical protein